MEGLSLEGTRVGSSQEGSRVDWSRVVVGCSEGFPSRAPILQRGEKKKAAAFSLCFPLSLPVVPAEDTLILVLLH